MGALGTLIDHRAVTECKHRAKDRNDPDAWSGKKPDGILSPVHRRKPQAVIEVMTDELNRSYWTAFRLKLERELSQKEIVIP